MQKQRILTTLLLLFSSVILFGQGQIRGILIDEETQEPLIGGIIQVEGTGVGAVTDIEGAYSIQVPAGIYTVIHSYIGYQDKNVSEVEVIDGEVSALGSVSLGIGGEGSDLEAVVVTAYVQKNSEEGLLNFQRESAKIVDAISAQSIAKTGDSDVAAVVRRVPGVTVEGGKYVYVRGLGDRYSKSIVNGMEIPGLDPERNTVQMDIFSSNIIDNIVVYKTFSPDLPGDFTGGMVDVITKDFPIEKTIKASFGLGYNSETTFSDSFLGATEFSAQDAFGFGKNTRVAPVDASFNPTGAGARAINEATSRLNKEAALNPQDNFLNSKFSFSYGNQYDVGKNKIGVTGAVNIKNDFSQRNNWVRNDIGYINSQVEDQSTQFRSGSVSVNEGLLNGLLNTAYKFENGKIGLKMMHTRTGETSVNDRIKDDLSNNQYFAEAPLDYFQRSISNAVLSGDFFLGENQDRVFDVAVASTLSEIYNPERHRIEMFTGDSPNGNYTFASNSLFQKEWRELTETNYNAKANYEIPFLQERGLDSKLKFGGAYNFKERDFENFAVNVNPSSFFDASLATIPGNDLNYILQSQNIIQPGQSGYGINTIKIDDENFYNADMSVAAGYAMTDYKISDAFKFIGGLRVEQAIMNFDGTEPNGTAINRETLNSTQLLPSANLVYEVKEYMNVRGSYNRTLARPSFKEKSTIDLYDAVLNQFFVGNIDLIETTVDNFDLRWEYYFDAKEMVSVSPFYKRFQDPIEMSFLSADRVTPINKQDADVLGFEFELRKDFGFINEDWEKLSVNSNFTLVNSTIDFTPNELLKYPTGTAPDNRELVGQAPFTVNTSFSYSDQDSGWEGNLGYNVKGKTLSIVGFSTQTYDVYEDPFHNLDFKLSKKLEDKLGSKFSISASNLLNDNIQYYYGLDDSILDDFQSYDIGQSFNFGYSIDIN